MLGREEQLRESLNRWFRRAEEGLQKINVEDGEVGTKRSYERMVDDARELLDILDGDHSNPIASSSYSSGSLARVIAAQSTVDMLVEELQAETERRLELERIVAGAPNVPRDSVEDGAITSHLSNSSHDPTENKSRIGIQQLTKDLPPTPLSSKGPQSSVSASSERPSVGNDDSGSGPSMLFSRADTDTNLSVSSNRDVEPLLSPAPPLASDTSQAVEETGASPDISLSSTTIQHPDLSEELTFDHFNDASLFVSEEASQPPTPVIFQPVDVIYQPSPRLPPDTSIVDNYSDPPPIVEIQFTATPILPTSSPPAPPAPIPISISPPPETYPSSISKLSLHPLDNSRNQSPHPLLAELTQVKHRYDDLQQAFRDCHLALQDLTKRISSPNTSLPSKQGVSVPILRTALERLDDYTEDARVELEIRTADETLLTRGFETILSVPGALSSSSSTSPVTDHHGIDDHHDAPTQSEIELQVVSFVTGTDEAVQKALRGFSKKLEDIQHDVASLKRVIHDPDLGSLSPVPDPATPPPPGSGWSSWIRSSPGRSPTPSSTSPAPTFGNIMTSPRLRHSPSLINTKRSQVSSGAENHDPFASLGLRVPMPSYVHIAPSSPRVPPQRTRTLSTMYMLGLRKPSDSFAPSNSTRQTVAIESAEEETETEEESDEDQNSASDVE